MTRKLYSDDFVLIPAYKATAEEKDNLDKIMRRGNKVFHKYHERIKQKIQGTGDGRYSRMRFRKELYEACKNDPKKIVVQGISISQADFSIINKVKEIEYDVLSYYSRIIFKLAKKWTVIDPSISFEDYYNEAVAAAIKSMWGFVKEDIKFMTYLHMTITRHMMNFTNENKPLSHWTQENKKLYGDFEQIRRKAGMEIGFDEIVKLMGLGSEEVDDLRSMLTKVISQIEFSKGGSSDDDAPNSIGIYSAAQVETKPVLDYDQMEAVRRTPMDDWERKVLEAYLEGGRGWASDVARNNVNPETGKVYSRRAPKLALDRVLARIKENCLGNVLSDAA